MSRPSRTTLDPRAFEFGEVASQHHVVDVPFDPTDPEAFAAVLHHLVERLPEPERSCVQMCAMRGISFREAAELLEVELGRLVDKQQTWRWNRRGMLQVRAWLEQTPWIGVLMEGRFPLPEGTTSLFGTVGSVGLDIDVSDWTTRSEGDGQGPEDDLG